MYAPPNFIILKLKGLLWSTKSTVSIGSSVFHEYFPISDTSFLRNIPLLFWSPQDTDQTVSPESYLRGSQ